MEKMCILSRSTFGTLGPKFLDQPIWTQGPKTVFRGPKYRFFCLYLRNGKRQTETLNGKNVHFNMTYKMTPKKKFQVLSNIMKSLATIYFLVYLLNCDRQLITCNGGNVYLIKIYIWYIGSKIIGPTVRVHQVTNRFQ